MRAQPRASKTELAGEHGGALKIRIAAPPVDGEANDELLRFLAKRLHVPVSRLHLVGGESSRGKTIQVTDITAVEALTALSGPSGGVAP